METKGWITIGVFAVLIIIGLFILLPILGIEMPDIGGYSSPGASYYGGEPTTGGEGGGAGFNWGYLLIIPVIAAVGYLGFRNLKDSALRLWFTPEGRKILKDKRRKREIKNMEDLAQLQNLLEKFDSEIFDRLNAYKKDKDWPLFSLYRRKQEPILEINDTETTAYSIKSAAFPNGQGHESAVTSIIRTTVSDLKEDWKFGVYTDSIPDLQMEFASLYAVIRWYYTMMQKGELPEMDVSEGRLNVFNTFVGKKGENAFKIMKSQDLNDNILKLLRDLLETYNSIDTFTLLNNCGLYCNEFGIDPQKSETEKDCLPYMTEDVDKLITAKYGKNKDPLKAVREYMVFGKKNATEIRKVVSWILRSYSTTLRAKENVHNIMGYLREQDVRGILKDAIQDKKSKRAFKNVKKSFGKIAHTVFKDELRSDLDEFNKLINELNELKDNDYNWWTHREYKEVIANINLRFEANTAVKSEKFPDKFPNKIALMYYTIVMPWIYTLLSYKLLYVVIIKYLESLGQMQEVIRLNSEEV